MATIPIPTDFDVIAKYESLVAESLDGDSVYIRAKETIQSLVEDGAIDDAQKADLISKVVSSIVGSITNSSMSTALAWATSEKEFALKKLQTEKQLDILDSDNLLKAAQIAQIDNSIQLAKVESRRMHGVPIFDGSGNLTALSDSGKVYEDIQLVVAQTEKVGEEIILTQQKSNESYAAVHKIIADTYVNYGSYTYTGLADNGVMAVTKTSSNTNLSEAQLQIAQEQAKGYTYNAWANALTGSASMLGTAIASEYSDFGPGSTGADLLQIVADTSNKLKNASIPAF